MRLLVTGGAGFIGSNFIRYWLEKYGEDEFRKIEKKTLYRFLKTEKNFVISTGAGILCDQDTINIIKKNSVCVFLDIKTKT